MIVEGFCRECHWWFDAHWHNYPKEDQMKPPYCLRCKGTDVDIVTDDMNEDDELANFEEDDL